MTLGGPRILKDGRIGHVVEIKGAIPSGLSPSSFSIVQTVITVTNVYLFSDNSTYTTNFPGGDDTPDPNDMVQNNCCQAIYEIDAPGPEANTIFPYFLPNPPQAPGQPSGTTVKSFTGRMDLKTGVLYNGCVCGTLLWYVQYTVTDASLDGITSSAGAE
jgi:hypothetical protein